MSKTSIMMILVYKNTALTVKTCLLTKNCCILNIFFIKGRIDQKDYYRVFGDNLICDNIRHAIFCLNQIVCGKKINKWKSFSVNHLL